MQWVNPRAHQNVVSKNCVIGSLTWQNLLGKKVDLLWSSIFQAVNYHKRHTADNPDATTHRLHDGRIDPWWYLCSLNNVSNSVHSTVSYPVKNWSYMGLKHYSKNSGTLQVYFPVSFPSSMTSRIHSGQELSYSTEYNRFDQSTNSKSI